MKRLNENIATASIILMFAAFPVAVVAELLGQKDLARFSLWAVIGSFIGACLADLPEARKEHSIAHLDIKIRALIEHRLDKQYPEYDEEKVVRRGARFMRQNVVPHTDLRHTYLTLLLLMEHKAIYLKETEDECLTWFLDLRKMPRFRYVQSENRGKCFSCLYWLDPDNEAEDYGKEPDELNCAVNPFHQDTQNGCKHYCHDWRKAELLECWAVRTH
ncbi:MAG: hypothetical protein HC851_18330 [Acaryochloris sp. RU_4_1]|nr:hypothetical protein [Acaryochloris sp. RU_4_1]NJR56149.1 hypothetical protein [Acaryochloris sp. CRU_2_0]